MLQEGDELIVFDNEHLSFLNSPVLKEFILYNKEPEHNNCSYFEYLSAIESSERFVLSKSIFEMQHNNDQSSENYSNVIEDTRLNPSTIPANNDLFSSNTLQAHQCLDIFNRDPELIIALLRSSILVEGKNLASGIYPIAKNMPAKLIIDAVMLQKEFKAGSEIAITNNLNTDYYNLSSLANITISPGMNLSVSSVDAVLGGRVKISGAVNKPGTYYISSLDRLSSIIDLAGGYKESAYPLGGVLIRESAKALEKSFNEKLYNDTIRNLSSQLVQGENIPFDAVSFVLNEFKSIEPSGRVITEFNRTLLKKDINSDLILEPADSIHIPKRSNVIYVLGEVLRPGPQSYNSSLSTKDFIKQAGGFTSSVDKSAVIVVYPNGETKLIKFGIFPGNDSILPGSVIYATRDFKKLNNLKLATTLAPIVSSIAISLASLNSISNN